MHRERRGVVALGAVEHGTDMTRAARSDPHGRADE